MNEKQRQKWRETRQLGKKRFVLIYGSLFTVFFWLLLIGVYGFIDFEAKTITPFEMPQVQEALVRFIFAALVGYLSEALMWDHTENKYNQKD